MGNHLRKDAIQENGYLIIKSFKNNLASQGSYLEFN